MGPLLCFSLPLVKAQTMRTKPKYCFWIKMTTDNRSLCTDKAEKNVRGVGEGEEEVKEWEMTEKNTWTTGTKHYLIIRVGSLHISKKKIHCSVQLNVFYGLNQIYFQHAFPTGSFSFMTNK